MIFNFWRGRHPFPPFDPCSPSPQNRAKPPGGRACRGRCLSVPPPSPPTGPSTSSLVRGLRGSYAQGGPGGTPFHPPRPALSCADSRPSPPLWMYEVRRLLTAPRGGLPLPAPGWRAGGRSVGCSVGLPLRPPSLKCPLVTFPPVEYRPCTQFCFLPQLPTPPPPCW